MSKLLDAAAQRQLTDLAHVAQTALLLGQAELSLKHRTFAGMQVASSWLAIMPKHASVTLTTTRTPTTPTLAEMQTIPTMPLLVETQSTLTTHPKLTIAIMPTPLKETPIGTMETSYRTLQFLAH
jgi:hypothetical protein